MWFLLLYLQLPVVQALDRIALMGKDSPCKGRLEVYHENKWGLVGNHHWIDTNGEVVCKTLGCGKYIKSSIASVSTSHTIMWMDDVVCKGNEKNLFDCKNSSWNVKHRNLENHMEVECEGNISLSLDLCGNTKECAGVVQFSTPNGKVSVCNTKWDKNIADKVCNESKCGSAFIIPKPGTFFVERSSHHVPFTCVGNEDFSWQCVNWASDNSNTCSQVANVICSDHKRVRLRNGTDICSGTLEEKLSSPNAKWTSTEYKGQDQKFADTICSKLWCGKSSHVGQSSNNALSITCSDRVEVELMTQGKRSLCYGELYIRVNTTRRPVCAADNGKENHKIGQVVCRELGCDMPITVSQESQVNNGFLSQVNCSGEEESLWECLAQHNAKATCKTLKVVCAGGVDVRLKDGFSQCSGRVEVLMEGSWWSVNNNNWPEMNSHVVCKQLGCQSFHTNHENFVNGKHPSLKRNIECGTSELSISKCTMKPESKINPIEQKTVKIICQGEQFWFLTNISSACEGRVEFSDYKGLTLLTTVNSTTAAKVCERTFCGEVKENAINSPNCSNSTSASCSIAHVTCSGPSPVNLTNQCWGKVIACQNGTCGGVCKDTWKPEFSKMLCEEKGCGTPLIKELSTHSSNVIVSSVYCSPNAKNFSQCNFVRMSETSNCSSEAYVYCSGSIEVRLQSRRDECAGKPEVFYSGQWEVLCNADQGVQNAFCKTIGCGDAQEYVLNYYNDSLTQGLSSVTCSKSTFSSCSFTKAEMQDCNSGYLKCKGWKRLFINNINQMCTGDVYVQSVESLQGISSRNWTQKKKDELCKYLQCSKDKERYTSTTFRSSQSNTTYDNMGNNSIWYFEEAKAREQNLNIKCEGEPEVTLLAETNCTGEVMINQRTRVCGISRIPPHVFNELCYKQNCSEFVTSWTTTTATTHENMAFNCNGIKKVNNLWQCNSWNTKCSSVISVACKGSVDFEFSQRCGGLVQVNYRGKWERVCPIANKGDADLICMREGCGKATRNDKTTSEPLETSVECDSRSEPTVCIKLKSCSTGAALVHCEKFTPEIHTPPPNPGLIAGLSIGLLFLLVAVVIVIWQRKRFLSVLRISPKRVDLEMNTNEMQEINSHKEDLLNRRQSQVEVDDYEDTTNPVENRRPIKQGDAEKWSVSEGSSGTLYDDVDEENTEQLQEDDSGSSQPFLPPRHDNLNDNKKVNLQELDDYDDVLTTQSGVSREGEGPVYSTSTHQSTVSPDDLTNLEMEK